MHKFTTLVTILILLVCSSVVAGIDRDSLHQARLNGLDKSFRLSGSPTSGFLSTAAASANDISISESVPPARFTQDHVSVVAIPTGGWLTVWQDDRLGSKKIFLQKLDTAGAVVGVNQVMAGSSVGSDFVDPEVAIDSTGRVFLFYRDQTEGLIFGSRYNSSLQVDVPPFLVNDTSLGAFAGPYDFAIYPNGRLVVTWENYAVAGSSIQMRIYSAIGTSVLGPTVVNTDVGPVNHWEPSVAIQPIGGFLITWEDYRNTQADVFARQFAGDGSAMGSDFGLVPPGPEALPQYTPRVAYSSIAGYVIAWVDLRLGQEIYMQQFSPTSGLISGNRLVSTGDIQVTNYDVDVAASALGNALVTWSTIGPSNNIMCRQYSSSLVAAAQPAVQSLLTTGSRWWPRAYFSRADRYGVGWTESADGAPDVRFMLFDTSGTRKMAEERVLNDDSIGAPSTSPLMLALAGNAAYVLFADRRNDAGDIWAQFVLNTGAKPFPNVRVNQDSGRVLQSDPSGAISSSKALFVWVDARAINGQNGQRIFGRFASLDGSSYQSEFMISDSTQSAIKIRTRAAMAADGQALVGWIDYRAGTPQVYAQWLTTNGALDGSETAISDQANDKNNSDLILAVDSSKRYYAVWLDNGPPTPTAKVRWYNANKTLGGSFSYSSTVPGYLMENISAAVTDSGDIHLLWVGTDGATPKLYLTILSRIGVVKAGPKQVPDLNAVNPNEPSVAVDEHNFTLAAWVDSRSGARRVYFNVLHDTTTGGSDQQVTSASPEFMSSPSVAARSGMGWFTWLDPRSNGLRAYAANILAMPTDVNDNRPLVPGSFSLDQNYPNPFNPSTEIGFSISHRTHLTLTVYNLLGARVKVLADGVYPEGHYRIEWDGTDQSGRRAASGTYFYRLSSDSFVQSRKMILLK
jgi:hypothetical protein